MATTRFDPFRELVTLQDRVNRAFGQAHLRDEDMYASSAWVPPVDIYETPGHDLVVKAEVPDVAREDIDVTIEHNVLRIKGTKKAESSVKEEQYRRVERSYGEFVRTFTLPPTVDGSKVTADYKNGVLTVTLPFKEEARPRTINVGVSAA